MDCKTCKESREVVSRHVHESDLDRMDRVNHRWFITWIITFVLLVGGVVFYFWHENQFETVKETVSYEVEQQADRNGNNSFVGGDYNGYAESESHKNQD